MRLDDVMNHDIQLTNCGYGTYSGSKKSKDCSNDYKGCIRGAERNN